MCIFPFLRLKHLRLEPVCNKPGIHCRVKNRSMSTNTDRRITFPYNSFANILNIFTSYCNNDFSRLCLLLITSNWFRQIRDCTRCSQSVMHINLAIVNTRDSFKSHFLLLKIATTPECSDVSKPFIFHIRSTTAGLVQHVLYTLDDCRLVLK